MSELTHALRTPDTDSKLRIQRKCGCGGSCGSCSEEEKKKKVQRRALGDAGHDIPRSVQSVLGSAGRPLDAETRASMESRFGRSFAEVRVHTDSHAAASAHDISAAAYTAGTHIVFGAGRFEPDTAHGRRLLAHELAHVAQQTSGASSIAHGIGPADDVHERAADRVADAVVAQGPAFAPPPAIVPVAERLVRRKREESEPAAEVEQPRFIVDDEMTPGPGQMRRQEFVEELDAVVCATSNREMAALGQSTDNCPLLARWRPRLRAASARTLETAIRRWGDAIDDVRNARDYIPAITRRIARAITLWGATRRIIGVPPELMALAGDDRVDRKISGGGGAKGLFLKARDGVRAPSGATSTLQGGSHLDTAIAARMGRAFAHDFSRVRIHTGATAANEATRLRARAFTIGENIAFADGEYRPGTIVGDALLAHELAHVAQQDDAAMMAAESDSATGTLEHDADDAAVHAVTSLWPGLRVFVRELRINAMPRLKSRLRLQRCKADCSVDHPEKCATYKQWLATMPTRSGLTADLTADMPKELRDLIGGATSSAGHLADCADVSMILRHYYLKATGKTFSFLVGKTRDVAQTYSLGAGTTDATLRTCLMNAGTQSFQETRNDFALIDFYKTKAGKRITNLKDLVKAGLGPGDVFIKKRIAGTPGGYEGHAQTVQQVVDAEYDTAVTPPRVTKPGVMTVVQGNMLHGKGVGKLEQRVYTFTELTDKDDGNGEIKPKDNEEFFGAGRWKGEQ